MDSCAHQRNWKMCRNAELKTMKYDYSDGGSYLWLDQCPRGKNIWNVMRYDATMETSTLDGMMLLYVDDIFMLAPTKTIQSTLTAIQNKWKMTITGIITRDGVTPEKPVTEINVLGCRVTAGEDDAIKLDQHGYIQVQLRDRDYNGTFGKTSLPDTIHKKLEPIPK